jgi:heme exporter protein B
MYYWNHIITIVRKDITTEIRAKEAVSAMLVFGLMVIVIFNFAFNLGIQEEISIAPGLLWVAFTFSGILGLNHSFAAEQDNDNLRGLMLAPIPRSAIYIGKLISTLLFMLFAEVIMLLFFVWLYDVQFTGRWHWLFMTMFLGTFGFSAVGTIFSAISSGTRMRVFLLPILQFPLVIPIIISSVEATAVLLNEGSLDNYFAAIKILLPFDVIFFTVCLLLFEYVLEE